MGQFSWLYADTYEQVVDGKYADTYLLVPKPFQEQFGKAIYEDCYDGYGHFGSYDVYELVALWNRDNLPSSTKAMHEPQIFEYDGLYSFEKEELRKKGFSEEEIENADIAKMQRRCDAAMEKYKFSLQRNVDFVNRVSDEEMKEKYGKNYLREIGIDIGCYDEDNAALKYPIKIVTKKMDYENVAPSPGDPYQGWPQIDDEEDDDLEEIYDGIDAIFDEE